MPSVSTIAESFFPKLLTLTGLLASLLLTACDGQAPQKTPQSSALPTSIAGPAPPANAPTARPDGAPAIRAGEDVPIGSGFDFYVLSLSWSPSYCEAEGGEANRQQCKSGRPYAFVVHGLWPQYEHGFPKDCDEDGRALDDETVASISDLMPSYGLIRHEWREHGTCSGLEAPDYFTVLRRARELVVVPQEYRRLAEFRVVAPADVEAGFRTANPKIPQDGISVACDKRYLRDVRICMTTQLGFRSCPELERRNCPLDKVVMPPVRGG